MLEQQNEELNAILTAMEVHVNHCQNGWLIFHDL
jgi:hypothetical protein